MSYADFETSIEDGAPIRLYQFTLGAVNWRYNSSDQQVVTTDGRVWFPAAISDDGAKHSGEATADALIITSSDVIAPVQLYKLSPPTEVMGVTILEKHIADTEVRTLYVGDVAQVNIPSPGMASITCETLSASMNREGLRLVWQRACPYALYDPVTCKVNKSLHKTDATINNITGTAVTFGSLGSPPAALFSGGFLEFTHPVKGIERIGIEASSGDVIYTFGPPNGLYVGLSVSLYRGCSQTPASCQSFGNYNNYGGVPSLPGRSPFEGLASPFF
jgi:uncharacterized phage protein (TIGR02218 family)